MQDAHPTPSSPAHGAGRFRHTVGGLQHWLSRLRIKVPRALCGESLGLPPGTPPLPSGAPDCPKCLDRRLFAPNGRPRRLLRWLKF
jgi:hypothetical protein